jgi:hypothetical protein
LAPRPSICDVQLAAPRAKAWALRPSTCPAPRHRPGRYEEVSATKNERRRGQRPGHHNQIPAQSRGHRLGHHDQVPATTTSGAADNGRAKRSSTCDAQRAAPRAAAGRNNQVPTAHNERRRGQRLGRHDQVLAQSRGHRLGYLGQVPATTTSGAADNGRAKRPSTY